MSSVGLLRQRKTTRQTKPAALFCQRKMLFDFGAFLIFYLKTSTLWLWSLMRYVQLEYEFLEERSFMSLYAFTLKVKFFLFTSSSVKAQLD